MKPLVEQLQKLWGQFTMPQRMTLGLGTIAVIIAMAALVMWSRQPDMKLLYGRLSEKDAADVVSALEAQGIKYEIGTGGNSIYVPARQGVPRPHGPRGQGRARRRRRGLRDFRPLELRDQRLRAAHQLHPRPAG
ncbi:MAG: hypothetical protein QM796_19875 [Chthoniobacteraceae bacterium]